MIKNLLDLKEDIEQDFYVSFLEKLQAGIPFKTPHRKFSYQNVWVEKNVASAIGGRQTLTRFSVFPDDKVLINEIGLVILAKDVTEEPKTIRLVEKGLTRIEAENLSDMFDSESYCHKTRFGTLKKLSLYPNLKNLKEIYDCKMFGSDVYAELLFNKNIHSNRLAATPTSEIVSKVKGFSLSQKTIFQEKIESMETIS